MAKANEKEYEKHQHQFPTTSRRDEYEVEKFMVDGLHFSHGHPLKSFTNFEENDDDHHFCRICGLPIFVSTPAYTCNNACKFFIHQQCALKLPLKLIHRTHRSDFSDSLNHILRIVMKPSTCTYECEDCSFTIHPLVAVDGIEIKLQHKIHPLHQMVAVCKTISSQCDVCGQVQTGFFFSCQDCNFWIHQDCTILPNMILIPSHPYAFILACSLPLNLIDRFCVVCHRKLFLTHNGIYFCPQSTKFAHIVCGIKWKVASKARLELMQLPNDELDALPSAVIQRYAKINRLGLDGAKNVDDDDNDELRIEKYGNHPLILTNAQAQAQVGIRKAACDLCTRRIPMSSSFYACGDHDHDYDFVAHKICVDILPTLKFSIPTTGGQIDMVEFNYPNILFCSIFVCFFCQRFCNGLCYHLPSLGEQRDPLCIDLECMAAPTTVNHASHTHNVLFRTHRLSEATPLACCPDNFSCFYDVYRCILCEYFIHLRCAVLPRRTLYPQYHHHPLHLLFGSATGGSATSGFATIISAIIGGSGTGGSTTISGDHFCEVCEEDIDLKYWFYRCSECDESFHIKCIPAVGFLSKVKFGKTYNLPESHSHPLKLKRMLTNYSQRCGSCRGIIQGLIDNLAFFCSPCHFWLHYACALAAHRITSDELNHFSNSDGAADIDIREIREDLDE